MQIGALLRVVVAAIAIATAAVDAKKCKETKKQAPSVVTVVKSPNDKNQALVVSPDCLTNPFDMSFDESSRLYTLGFDYSPSRGPRIERVESFPDTCNIIRLNGNKVSSADFRGKNTLVKVYLGENEIVSLDGFKFPRSLKSIDASDNNLQQVAIPKGVEEVILSSNQIASMNDIHLPPNNITMLNIRGNPFPDARFQIPSNVQELHMGGNAFTSLEGLEWSSSFLTIRCFGCNIPVIRGIKFAPGLKELDIISSEDVTVFEIRQSDLKAIQEMQLGINVNQDACLDETAVQETLEGGQTVCVIDDDRFEQKYVLHTIDPEPLAPETPVPEPSSSGSSRSASNSGDNGGDEPPTDTPTDTPSDGGNDEPTPAPTEDDGGESQPIPNTDDDQQGTSPRTSKTPSNSTRTDTPSTLKTSKKSRTGSSSQADGSEGDYATTTETRSSSNSVITAAVSAGAGMLFVLFLILVHRFVMIRRRTSKKPVQGDVTTPVTDPTDASGGNFQAMADDKQ